MADQSFRIAAAQYPIGSLINWADYTAKIQRWVGEAADNGARLLLFPEYFSLELASLFPQARDKPLSREFAEIQLLLPDFMRLFADLARQRDLYIVAGSFPVRQADGLYRNRAFLFRPDGPAEFQDKLQLTRFETAQGLISAGEGIATFATGLGRIGICICYDSEFPMIARKQVEAGAQLILVPSCTDTAAGYWRVRIGCQARALENQCYVVQSPTVGQAPWSTSMDQNIGAAGVYTPMDHGYPDNGVLAIGEMNQAQWVYAEIDLGAIAERLRAGQVANYLDWPGQFRYL